MKNLYLLAASAVLILSVPSAQAQNRAVGSYGGGPPVGRYVGATNQINPLYLQQHPYMPNPYLNQYYNPYAGYGYNPYNSPVFYPSPRPLANGFFNIGMGGLNINLWKAPSGYYYPWCNRNYSAAQIIYVQDGSSQASPQLPPLATMFTDLNAYLEDQKAKGKIAEGDYQHLRLRSKDLQVKSGSLRNAGGGQLDPNDEAQIRKDLDQLSTEVAQRTKI